MINRNTSLLTAVALAIFFAWGCESFAQKKKKEVSIVYRVIIFNGDKKSKPHALRVKEDFESKHPNTKAYVVFENPNYMTQAGDFKKKSDAKDYRKAILEEYPHSLILKKETGHVMLDTSE